MKKQLVKLPAAKDQEYPIVLKAGIFQALEPFVSQEQHLVIITDHAVKKIYGDALRDTLLQKGFRVSLLSFPAGERSKNAAVKERLELAMLQQRCGRDTTILALGGGVVGDVAGFVAATYLRGIPYLQLPTTLLAMVDSSIGGKTGINTKQGKNLIGAFWQPSAVIVDLDCLKTLSQKQVINGLIEVVKIFLTSSSKQFYFLQRHLDSILGLDLSSLKKVITAATQLKINVVEQDEKESQERMILNFGHTIGHAIERLSHYKMLHGYAVALGILVEVKISELLGICSADDYVTILNFFKYLRITPRALKKFAPAAIVQATRYDKKNITGTTRYVLLRSIGEIARHQESVVHAVPDHIVLKALSALNNLS